MFSFLAGMGAGVLRGEQTNRDRKREDERDQMARMRFDREGEQYERAKRQQDRADAEAEKLRAAGAPVEATSGEVYQPAVDDEGIPMLPNPTAGTGMVGGQRYATMAEAQAKAGGMNSPAARVRRQADELGNQGKVMEMAAAQDLATRMERDGHLKLIESVAASAPSVADVKAGKTHFPINPAVVQQFNSAGGDQLQPGAYAVAKVVKLDNGREVVDFGLHGADGKPIDGAGSAKAIIDWYGKTVAQRDSEANAMFESGQRQANSERDFGLRSKAEDRHAATENARLGLERERLGLARMTVENRAASGGKADHFDEKQWDAAMKVEPSFVTFGGADGAKGTESPELRLVYRAELNAGRSAGTMSPTEASEAARTTTLKLKNAAEDRVAAARAADPKSTLTESQAVRLILKEFEAASRKPQTAAPAAAPVPPAPPTDARPGLVERATSAVGNAMASMRATGGQYQAIEKRAREAGAGGPPLTNEERLLARQFGLMVR